MSDVQLSDTTEKVPSTREALIAAGLKCFAESGYTGARLSDIVEQTGLTTGAFYRRFSSKAEFFHVLFVAYGDELQSALATSGSFAEQVEAWIRVGRRHLGVVRASAEIQHLEPGEMQAQRRLREVCGGLIAQKLPDVGDWRKSRAVALMLADTVAQYVLMEAAGWVEERDPATVARALARLVENGLYRP